MVAAAIPGKGEGEQVVEMQFLADVAPGLRPAEANVLRKCWKSGTGESIADVLNMSVDEAIGIFR